MAVISAVPLKSIHSRSDRLALQWTRSMFEQRIVVYDSNADESVGSDEGKKGVFA